MSHLDHDDQPVYLDVPAEPYRPTYWEIAQFVRFLAAGVSNFLILLHPTFDGVVSDWVGPTILVVVAVICGTGMMRERTKPKGAKR